jgi:hypothetical protein
MSDDATYTELAITELHADVDGDGALDNVELYQTSDGYAEVNIDLDGDYQSDVSMVDVDGDGEVDAYIATPAALDHLAGGDAADSGVDDSVVAPYTSGDLSDTPDTSGGTSFDDQLADDIADLPPDAQSEVVQTYLDADLQVDQAIAQNMGQ